MEDDARGAHQCQWRHVARGVVDDDDLGDEAAGLDGVDAAQRLIETILHDKHHGQHRGAGGGGEAPDILGPAAQRRMGGNRRDVGNDAQVVVGAGELERHAAETDDQHALQPFALRQAQRQQTPDDPRRAPGMRDEPPGERTQMRPEAAARLAQAAAEARSDDHPDDAAEIRAGVEMLLGEPADAVHAEAEVDVDVEVEQGAQDRPGQRDAAAANQPPRHEQHGEHAPQQEPVVTADRGLVDHAVGVVADHQSAVDFEMAATQQGGGRYPPVEGEEIAVGEGLLEDRGAEQGVVAAVVGGVGEETGEVVAHIARQRVGPGREMAGLAGFGEQHPALARHRARLRLEGGEMGRDEAGRPEIVGGRPHEIGRLGGEQDVAEIHRGAEVVALADIVDARVSRGVGAADLLGGVGGTVVGDDQREIRDGLGEKTVQRGRDGGRAVIDRHSNGHAHGEGS